MEAITRVAITRAAITRAVITREGTITTHLHDMIITVALKDNKEGIITEEESQISAVANNALPFWLPVHAAAVCAKRCSE
jgi:hypothetical protein